MAGDRRWSDDVSLGHLYGQVHLDHSALIDTFPELPNPNDTLPLSRGDRGGTDAQYQHTLREWLNSLPIATTSDIDPTVKVGRPATTRPDTWQ